MSRIMLSCLLFLSSATAFASIYVTPSPETMKVLPVPEAIALFQQYLDEHPESARGWSSLGSVYANAYARGMDAIEVIHDASSSELPNPQGIGIPPMTAARRLDSVSGPRLNYLVQALRAYQQAVKHADKKDKEAALLGLGYALYESRDRFVNYPWPLDGTPFDAEAKEHGSEPRWWQDQALAVFRQTEMPESNNEEDLWGSQDSGRTKSAVALYVVQILQVRSSRTEEEEKELTKLKKTADRYLESQSMYPPIKPALPPQPREIEAIYPVTPAGTATSEVYLRALDALLMEVNINDLPIVGAIYDGKYQGKPLSPDMLQNIGSYLGHHAETFRLLSEAARGQECRYPIDFNKGAVVELPYLAPLRQLGRVQALRVLHAAESGDSTTVATAISDSIALADSLRREPVVISQLVRIALIGILVEALQDAQNRMALDSNDLRVLQERLATLEGLDGLVVAFKGESFSMQQMANEPAHDLQIPDTPHLSATDRAEMIRNMKERFDSAPTPQEFRAGYEYLLVAAGLPFRDAREAFEQGGNTDDRYVNRAMTNALVAFYRCQAQLRAAQAALAADRYSRTNSGPPESLNDLVPVYIRSLPLDPFNDEPMRYELLDGGFMVYSVGDNLVDDNGAQNLESGPDQRPVRMADVVYKVGGSIETAEGEGAEF